MAKEIERKFLLKGEDYKKQATPVQIMQGYLNRDPERTVRIRIKDTQGFLTIKGKNHGLERMEFEYLIPVEDALEMLKLCYGRIIEKTRWIYRAEDEHIWEIDEFKGDLYPLVVAEVEIENIDEQFTIPQFIGEEVTGDPKYYNSAL